MFRFEKLDVWRKAVNFAGLVHSATRRFPAEERFGLTAQMQRASVSISSNIAEGSSRFSRVDFARFIEIAYGSLMEVVSQSFVAKSRGILKEERFLELYTSAEELSRMLSGLKSKLNS